MIRPHADCGQRLWSAGVACRVQKRFSSVFSGRVRWFGAVMRKLSGSLGFLLVVLLSGCSAGNVSNPTSTPAPAVRGLQGVVHGGQQALTGATLKLWAVASTGDGVAATSLATVTTGANGSFTLTGLYTCPG